VINLTLKVGSFWLQTALTASTLRRQWECSLKQSTAIHRGRCNCRAMWRLLFPPSRWLWPCWTHSRYMPRWGQIIAFIQRMLLVYWFFIHNFFYDCILLFYFCYCGSG